MFYFKSGGGQGKVEFCWVMRRKKNKTRECRLMLPVYLNKFNNETVCDMVTVFSSDGIAFLMTLGSPIDNAIIRKLHQVSPPKPVSKKIQNICNCFHIFFHALTLTELLFFFKSIHYYQLIRQRTHLIWTVFFFIFRWVLHFTENISAIDAEKKIFNKKLYAW